MKKHLWIPLFNFPLALAVGIFGPWWLGAAIAVLTPILWRVSYNERQTIPDAIKEIGNTRTIAAVEGRERRAAVVFVDIRDFTFITGNLEPSAVFRLVNRVMREIVPIVHDHDGEIEKFTGDGFMATFGLHRNSNNPALDAVSASLKIQVALAGLNFDREFQKEAGLEDVPLIELGIGVAKGNVLTGRLGIGGAYEITALGRTVNLAARLCSKASRGEVRCCNFCYLDIEPYASYSRGEHVRMKGIEFDIKTWVVQGLHNKPTSGSAKTEIRCLNRGVRQITTGGVGERLSNSKEEHVSKSSN